MALFHAMSAFHKAKVSADAQDDILEARQAVGGFGYSYYSKFSQLININDVNTTFEGDNKVLLTQTSKYILKNTQNVLTGKPCAPSLAYIKDYFDD